MGIGNQVIKLTKDITSFGVSKTDKHYKTIIFLLSNGYRDSGEYKKALKVSKKLPRRGISDRIFRLNRIAGDYWLMGSTWLAGLYFLAGHLWYLFSKKVHNKEIELGIYEELLLDFLHWFRDTKLSQGLLKKNIPFGFALYAYNYFKDDDRYLFIEPHAIGKLNRLLQEIPNLKSNVKPIDISFYGSTEYVSIFQETDSILGVINFYRSKMLNDFIENNEIPSKSELEKLILKSQVIGDKVGLLKGAMILKKIYAHEYDGTLENLRKVEWILWKKAQWLFEWRRYKI